MFTKIFLKKSLLTFLLLLALFIPSASYAADDTTPDKSCNKAAVSVEFANYWLGKFGGSSFFSKNGNEILSYFTDIITMATNQCLFSDLNNVYKKMDAEQKAIRAAFYACRQDQVATRAQRYIKTESEYFFMTTAYDKFKNIYKKELKNQIADKMFDFVPSCGQPKCVSLKDQIAEAMKEELVKNRKWLTLEENDKYLNEFIQRYQDRLLQYVDGDECASPVWEDLKIKWNEFLENMKETGGMFVGDNKEIQKQQAKEKREEERRASDAKQCSGFWNCAKEYLLPDIAISINNAEPKKGWSQVMEGMRKNMPFNNPSMVSVQNKINQEENRYNESVAQAEEEALYNFKYNDLGASIAEDLKNIIADPNEGIIKVLQDSITTLNSIKQCSDGANKKECKNKP